MPESCRSSAPENCANSTNASNFCSVSALDDSITSHRRWILRRESLLAISTACVATVGEVDIIHTPSLHQLCVPRIRVFPFEMPAAWFRSDAYHPRSEERRVGKE